MKSEWTYRPLGELVSFASGGTPSKKKEMIIGVELFLGLVQRH